MGNLIRSFRSKNVSTAPSPGGRFKKCRKRIGSGGFKAVFHAIDTQTGELVAWGELLDEKCDSRCRKAFRDEAELMRQLQHPNILEWRGYFDVKLKGVRRLVLLTELMPAGTIRKYIDHHSRIQLSLVRSWCRDVLQGLHFLHSLPQPVVHRDLKCGNLFLRTPNGPVKIGDFGLATMRTGHHLTEVVGTAGYMAPEIYDEYYDEAVDVYAFGMTVLEMATSNYPYMECFKSEEMLYKAAAGIMPASLQALQNEEVRDFIQMCIKPKRKRPTCSDLLKSDFLSRQENDVLEFPDLPMIIFLPPQRFQHSWRKTETVIFPEATKQAEVM